MFINKYSLLFITVQSHNYKINDVIIIVEDFRIALELG